MEYIKKEELIEGEIYNSTSYNHIFKYCDKNGDKNPTISKTYKIFNKDLATVGNGLYNIINATSEEKHWLNTCIEQDKFITFKEAMKTFIPEYVECTQEQYLSSYKVGIIYKLKNNLIENEIGGMAYWTHNQHGFKPSTKEAYDAQFVVKEPEFVLPEVWCIKVTEENRSLINELRRKKSISCKNPIKYDYLSSMNFGGTSFVLGTEITFEQFKKYVLKEEIAVVEEKVIEPLPQFKVIETIETITKVENNEGNQFFIGDVVKTITGTVGHKILSFKYNVDKTEVIALTNNNATIGIGINKLEHYIKPKAVEPEFILPEKWAVQFNDRWDVLSKFKPFNDKFNGSADATSYYKYNSVIQFSDCDYRLSDYTLITLDQFKKYVLKEEVKEETLLEKDKRLYPTI